MNNIRENIFLASGKVQKFLVFLFFISFTLNIRKVFLTPHSFPGGEYNEFASISVIWADLLIFLIITLQAIKYVAGRKDHRPNIIYSLYNKRFDLSTLRKIFSRETILLIFFVAWAGISTAWSISKPIALFKFVSLVELAAFAVLLLGFIRDYRFMKHIYYAILAAGLFQAILGLLQVSLNRSLGALFLGESILNPQMAGVAKILIFSEKHIRAYGTFPHPNILAAFLLIPIFIVIWTIIIRRGFVSRETEFAMPRNIAIPLLAIYVLGLMATFSRAGLIGFCLGTLTMLGMTARTVIAGLRKEILSFVKHSTLVFILFLMLAAASITLLNSSSSFFSLQSLNERYFLQTVSYETISNRFWQGVGIGQFVINEYARHPDLKSWQYQPVHNVPLLILSELGIVGLLIIGMVAILWCLKNFTMKRCSYLTASPFCVVVISFLPLLIFDHFFWDLKIGIIIFSLTIIFSQLQSNDINCENCQ